jgi:hypothetical protein
MNSLLTRNRVEGFLISHARGFSREACRFSVEALDPMIHQEAQKTIHRHFSSNTNDINSVSLRGAERRSNPKQRRDCRALRARNDCNDNFFVCNELPRRKQRGIGSEVVFHAPQAAGN